MNDWFNVVENGHYRRNALLTEANQNRRLAMLHDDGVRAATAALLIKVALWLAPATSSRRTVVSDERILPRVARI